MPPLAAVKDLEVFEECGGKFDPRLPSLAVEELDLDSAQELLHHGVVEILTG